MDPEACLVRAQSALDDSDFEECREAIRDYHTWRVRGGFMPENGDERAAQISLQLSDRDPE